MKKHKPYQQQTYIAAQFDYLDRLSKHFDYAITLQTNLSTYGINAATMERHLDATRSSLHKFRMRLNRLLTGNGFRRKNDYLPLFVPTIEGSVNTYDKHRTLHIHAALGNLPATATAEILDDGVRQLWSNTSVGTPDIKLVPTTAGTEHRWSRYCTKEAIKGNWEVVDYSNTQVPDRILSQL
jgi:hypothetical protein